MKIKRIISAMPLAVGLAATAGATAHAAIQEIIVTAERREAPLQKTQIAITAMGAQTLSELGITDYVQIGDFAPNVSMHDIPTSFGGAIGIRGFRNGETISTFEPKVALYLDGVLIAKNAGSAFDVLDLERVEILRGPQGTLYGRNTVGGAVNLITKKPTDEAEGKISATIGNFSQHDLKATVNVPLMGPNGVFGGSGGSELNVRATFATLNHDGYWENKFAGGPNKDFGDKDRVVGHVQLQWKPTDALSFLYAFDKTKVNEVNPAPVIIAAAPASGLAPYILSKDQQKEDRLIDNYQHLKGDVEGHSLTINWDVTDHLSVVSISALRKMEYESAQDADGTPVWVINTLAGDKTKTFTQEVRAVGDLFNERVKYVGGVFYMDEDIQRAFTYNQLPAAGGLSSNIDGTAKNKNWAVFGQTTTSITDRLNLTLGLRYTREKREMTRTDSLLFDVLPFLNTVTVLPKAGPKNFDDLSGTASLGYQWTDDIMTYVKYSRGYTSGGFNLRSPSPATFTDGYREEHVNTYEIGWKTTWFADRLLVNGAIFYNDFKDLQVTVLDPATTRNNLANAANAVLKGAELEVQARPVENLELGGGYGYLDTKYKNYIDPTTHMDVSDVNKFAHAPKHQLNAYGRYVIPEFKSVGDLVFRADYVWQSKSSLLAAPGNEIDSYGIVNGRIAIENIQGPGESSFTFAVWGKNLGNKLYYTSGYNLVTSLGFDGKFTGAPRTFGGEITANF